MSNNLTIGFEENLSKSFVGFDESTLISPNKNGEKQKGIIDKFEQGIKKDKLIEFCNINSISINELFLAALTLTLNKFNFSHEILIFNENNVPFSVKFENREISIKELLTNIRNEYKKTLEYDKFCNSDDFPLKPEFYYSFNESLNESYFDYSNYLSIIEKDNYILLSLLYNNELYTKDYIDLFLSGIEKIIRQIVNGDIEKTNICDIALEDENENIFFSEVEIPFIHKRFEKQVCINPDNIALVASDVTLTYRQLDEKSNVIANALIDKGVKPKSNVLVMLQRDSNLITSILGILKAGCAFIPVDPEYPQERIKYIYEDSQADFIVSNKSGENSLDVNELLCNGNPENPDVNVECDDLAFIIYTSGSTGKPKGVMISHENVCNQIGRNPLVNYNDILTISTISFVMSIQDILTGITNGSKLIFASDSEVKNIVNLIKLIKNQKPEVMTITPSRLLSYLEVDEFCDAISCFKCIITGGELFSVKAFNAIKKYTNAVIFDAYGQSEVSGVINFKEISDSKNIAVGKSLENSISDVRDIDGKLLPDGVMGELYFGGPCVGKGYYNLDKTKDVFIEINGVPYCRSGDYAIRTYGGEFIVKGRIDNQIKLRGLRIEIGEIEYNIGNYPNIKENAVIIKEINNNMHLCAYYTVKGEVDKNSLRNYLKDRLVNYMVPTAFMQLDEIPRTPSGKKDLKQLPEPKLEFENVSPANDIEEKLFEMLSEFINDVNFGVTDNLYALGFTSLSLMKFNVEIYESFNINLNITELLDNPTIRHIANLIENNESDEYLNELMHSSNEITYYPLMDNQLGVYYECAQNPDVAQYNLPAIVRFDKSIDALKLKEAIIKTIDAYPYLKTRIVLHYGQLMHKREDSIPIDEIPIIEINDISDERIEKENVKRFKLLNNQLFRAKIYKTDNETILFFDIHHIISDGESLGALFNNFANAYNGEEIEKEVFNGYICSLIEKEDKNSEKYVVSEKYFHNQLTNEVDSTILTPNLSNDENTGELESIYKSIDSQSIKEFCADKRISPNILFMASTILTLNKYTFSDKTLLTTIFNGRLNSNYYNTQSFLVKTLPMVSINKDRNISVREFLNQIDEIWKNGIKHSIYPYIKISEEFKLKPEFMYTYNDLEIDNIKLDNEVYNIKRLNSLETNYKITFDVNEKGDNIELVILYNNGLYSREYIKTFLNSVLSTLNQFINENIEQLKINEIELNNYDELPTFTPVENPCIHKRFEKQAIEKADGTALVASDATLTYAELNEKSNRIANALINRGVKPKSNILVLLSRDSNLIASILGILKAGCAFVPIDPEYPKERINYIYENSQADYIISNKSSKNSLNVMELLEEENIENPNDDILPDDLAYMIYTSGSTGNPKGVMISHENICNQISNPKSTYSSLLCITTISFDVAMDDILTSLSNGLKLIFADDIQIKNIPELTKLIKENKPEVADFTPSRLGSYLEVKEFCEAINCLKCVFLGGEQFSTKVYEELRKYCDAIVYNSYGPTETTITSNNKQVIDVNDITVGHPLDNYITDVRDIDGKLLPVGVMGELYIGGTGVGKGYYNMPEKTKEVFLTINNIPYYRSGDYAIKLPNGEIDIKGRIDNQIKLRGLRIEIGEIETNISKYPNIKHVVVVIKQINNNDHLCAYYTADAEIDSDDLKEYLKGRLTRYMIPTVFMQLEEMPQTPNGKTDVKNLPEPILITEYVAPKNEVQRKLYDICSEILDFRDFGITDNLFSLGFSSLSLMKLSHEIYSSFNATLSFKTLMDAENICDLENMINDTTEDIEKINYEKQEYYPLSHNQLNVYIESVKNPDKLIYNMVNVIEMGNNINPEKLKKSLIKVFNHHSYLKSIITQKDGEICIKRQDDAEVNVDVINKECTKKIQEKFAKPFNLLDSPLYRAKIFNYDNQTTLLLDIHHIIFDGISFNIFLENLINAYQGNDLLEEKYTGFEYILEDYRQAYLDSYKESEEFFNSKISEIDISTDIIPNMTKSIENAKLGEHYNSMSKDFIDKYCKEYNITPNNLFLSATLLTLSKYTYTKDMLIATISSGRLNPNYENTLAMVVKTLPFIHKIDTSQSVGEYFDSIQNTLTQTINHENYPYTKLFEKYNINPNIYYAYQVGIVSENQIINDEGKINYINVKDVSLDLPKFNLSVYIEEDKDNYLICLRYNDALYSSDFIANLTNNIELMVKKLQKDLNVTLDTISLLPYEREKELCEIHNSFEHIDINTNLKELFECAVEKYDEETALIDHGQTLSYNQLNSQVNKIANSLVDLGIVSGDHIILKLERSVKLIFAIYAVIKTGASFTIVSTEQPEEQTEFIKQDTGAKIIIQSNIDELLTNEKDNNLDTDIKPDDLACIVYTSGSTGKPKGVKITHKGLINYINPREDNIAIHAIQNDVSNMLSLTTTTFIAFLREALATIINGTKVTLASDEESKNLSKLIRLINESNVDGLSLTPSRIQEYMKVIEFKDLLQQFKVITIGGEKFIQSVYVDLSECSDAKIFNSYGSSENTIATHQKLLDSDEITEGTPIPNNIDLIIDIDGNPLPNNIIGEICTAGVQTSPGYLNRDDLNESEFITVNNLRFYKTGDLAYKNSNDELVVIGRKDKQIKLRGQRIEPGEIESVISKYPGIESVVVTVKQINNQENLCAYYTSHDKINVEELTDFLSTKLIRYMIPTSFTQLNSMPKTPNGKIDTKNLPLPKISTEYVSAENELEESIFKICADIVGFDDFGVTDNLYGLGFTSLTIMSLSTEIYNVLDKEINVTNILQKPTIRNIAENIEINEVYDDMADEFDDESKYYELTPNQLGVYFDCVKNFEKVNYNLPKYIDFGIDIDENRLKSAIIKVINYHPYLKTRIVMQEGVAYQERRDNLIIDDLIEIVEVDGIDDKFKEEFVKPFDLSEGPLFRFKIVKNKDNVSLLCDFHHIILDGTSLNILFRQIASVYDNLDLEFNKNELEPLDGFDYSQKEVNVQKSRHYKESEMFFFNKIKEHDEGSLISPDLNGIEEEGQSCEKSKVIDKEMVDEFCNEISITPNNLFLSISSFVLSKFVNSRNLLFATITNGRFSPEEQNTLAMMVKTLPISLKLDSDLSFKEYFDYINKEWVNTISHSSYPLTEIVTKYGIIPEFVFAFNGKIIEEIEINGKVVEREGLEYDDLQFKLSLDVAEINEKYKVVCQYNDALYSPDLIDTFLDGVIIVLNKLTKYGSDELENVLLKDISIIERDVPNIDDLEFMDIGESRIDKIFEKQVESNGDKVILTASDGDFTFNELNEKANRVANALIKKGVEIEDKVMFILKRNSNVLASIFGILKAGAAFIPVDSEYPQERIEHVLSDSESKFIIFDDIVGIKGLDLSSCSDKLINIDELLKEENISNPNVDISPENLAYLIYTSGSTGLPKGVMIEHRNFANFIHPHPSNSYCYELVSNAEKENYKILSLVTVAFDTFLDEMLLPILNGVPVVFADDNQFKDSLKLIPLIEKTNANVFDGTPSRLLQYLEIDGLKELIADFKIFVVGGEAFPKHLYDILSKVSDAKIFNSYGPTEITVACNDKLINQPNVVSVGGPMLNVYEEIMDMDSNPLPPHVLGELFVAGKGVSRAYYNRPEKNAEAYITINGIKFYRTGDLAKWDVNGEVEILGRLDDQIKLRGLRIEIGEIESAIKEFEGIESLAVVVKKIKGNDHLCAYFTVYDEFKNDDEGYSIDIDALKDHLSAKLTYYMVPTVYMELDEMPQTLNGKTDLRNLPEPVLIMEYVAPENDIEAFFADTFAEILSLDKVGVTDNFFEIGGTSLLVTKITLAALNRDYNISYGDVFDNPTPRKLSEFILTDEDLDVSLSEEFDYDYSEINELLKKNTLDNFIKSENVDDLGDVLLTGATGFLGIHVLRELLENSDSNVYCLIRSRSNLSSEDRLKSLLFYYFSNNYEELFNNRLHIIDGDITSYADFEKLISYNINTIFNCAANVKHFSSGTDIEDINFGGVLNGLEFAKLKSAKYVQVSTYSVAGESINSFPPADYKFNERDLFVGQGIDNQYLRSKFLAERAILEAAIENDLSVKIMRVGNLMARSYDGEFQINFVTNGFINRLKAFVTIGKMPYSLLNDTDELSPIDVTAKSIVELSKTPKECVVFHPYQHHTICFGDILDIMKSLGIEIEAVEEEEYDNCLNQALNDKNKQEGISGLITSIGSGKFKKIWIDAENDYTIQVLYRLGVKWPIISEDYIYKFIEYLNDMSFFD